jgi:Brp/Blh family beta-carotene 15,15'-monooxygenase
MDPLFQGSAEHDLAGRYSMMERQFASFGNLLFGRPAAVLLFPAVTLLLVLATILGAGMKEPALIALLAVGVVCLGVPHGALDPMIARTLWGTDRRLAMPGFLAVYTLLAVLCAAGWIAAPSVALSIFLAISALHFGSDWNRRGSFLSRAAYGGCVVTVPALHHGDAVRQIYLALGATDASGIVRVSQVIACVVAAVAVLSLLPEMKRRWQDLLELAVILIAGMALTPLVFFACYFCLLHSPRHLAETARDVGLRGVGSIAKAAAPTVVATLLLAAVLWYFLPAAKLSNRVLEIIFIGLAALTVPHMLLSEIRERHQRHA